MGDVEKFVQVLIQREGDLANRQFYEKR